MSDESGKDGKRRSSEARGRGGAAFLLTQVGTHAALKFAERLSALGLTPPHAGILRALSPGEGMSQRALCRLLNVLPSRLVVLLDELEELKLVERRDDPEDRRSYALYLTEAGRAMVESVGKVAREHEEEITKGLTPEERVALIELLRRIAEKEGLTPGVHPGFSRLGKRGRRSSG